jgi:hypothetical protein
MAVVYSFGPFLLVEKINSKRVLKVDQHQLRSGRN